MNTSRLFLQCAILPAALLLGACSGNRAPAAPQPAGTSAATTATTQPAGAAATPGTPAAPGSERVAYIVAVVGDSAITNIALFDAMVQRFAQERKQPVFTGPEADRVRREVLDDEITELVLLQAAQKDTTIKVDDERIRRGVDQEVSRRQREVGGAAQFERLIAANGSTLAEFREYLGAEMRRNEMIRQYLGKVRQNRKAPPAAEKDIREFFEKNREQLVAQWGPKPALVTVDHIVMPITPSEAAEQRAKARIDSAYAELRAGGNFEQLARRYSDEVATREKGGELGWIKESEVVREFARVAFSMPPGQYSYPVRTSFGWHIIKVERARGGEALVRHILVMPEITDEDVARTKQRGDSIANLLRAGADPAPLARQFGDPELDARIGPEQMTAYEQTYIALGSSTPGTVVGPTEWGEGPRRRIIVAKVSESSPAGQWSLDDQQARDYIERTVEDEKLMDELVGELRRSIFVKILQP